MLASVLLFSAMLAGGPHDISPIGSSEYSYWFMEKLPERNRVLLFNTARQKTYVLEIDCRKKNIRKRFYIKNKNREFAGTWQPVMKNTVQMIAMQRLCKSGNL